jgi:outer membrane lipoprotein LolB
MKTPPVNQQISWSKRKALLQHIQHWRAQGIVGVRYKNKAQTANVNIMVNNNQYQLQLYGPLGADRVIIDGNANRVSMRTSDGRIYNANTPEHLLTEQLGWSLPVINMLYWLRGLPAPNLTANIRFDEYHHIKNMRQQGWLIHYSRFSGVNNYDLPTKIIMHNHGLTATIVIGEWQLL